MPHFKQDFFDFFSELSQNNNTVWFNENKKRYEAVVKKPFQAFMADFLPAFKALEPRCLIEPKQAMFRINRDIRFSKDKTPYKLHTATALPMVGVKKAGITPGFYIGLGLDECAVGGGLYELDKDTLYKVRSEILYNMDEFKAIAEDKDFKKKCGSVHGEVNKVVPPPFKEEMGRQPLLANKQFYYWKNFEQSVVLSDELIPYLLDTYKTGQPFLHFINRALDEVAE